MASVGVSRCRVSARTIYCLAACLALSACGGDSTPSRAPTISTVNFSVDEDTTLSASLSLSDPNGSTLQVSVTTPPTSGTLSGPTSTGAFTFAPAANFFGNVSFVVNVVNAQGLATAATVSITVNGVNDRPLAVNDSAFIAPGTSGTIRVLDNDSDIEGQPLLPELVGSVSNGSASVNSDGTILFTPQAGFAGSTSFQYRVADSQAAKSDTATVAVTVRPLNGVVFVTAPGVGQKVVYADSTGERPLYLSTSNTRVIDALQLSQDKRIAIWSVGDAGSTNWFRANLANGGLLWPILSMPSSDATNVLLSPQGTYLLESESATVLESQGRNSADTHTYASNYAYLIDVQADTKQLIDESPGASQILSYRFSLDSQTIFYRTNLPARFDSSVTYRRAPVSQPQSSTLLWQAPTANDSGGIDFLVTPDATKLVFPGSIGNPSVLMTKYFFSSATSLSVAQPLGPGLLPPLTYLNVASVSPDGTHAAFSTRDSNYPGASQTSLSVFGLNAANNNLFAFSAGVQLGNPVFSRDGSRVAYSLTTPGGSVIQEVVLGSVQSPNITPVYAGTVHIVEYKYAANGQLIYVADPIQSGQFGLFIAQNGSAVQLNADMGTSIAGNSNGDSFILSPDGMTVAYVQSEFPTGPLSLYIVNVTTPGLPTLIGTNIKAAGSGPLQFDIR